MCRPADSTQKILIIEDQPDDLETLQLRLQNCAAHFSYAPDGQTALDLLHEASRQQNPFSLVILDYRLPDRDGLELLRELRADPELNRLKVLLLTCADELAVRVDALQFGADDFLMKTCSAAELTARVQHLLEREISERRLLTSTQKAQALQEISKRITEDIASRADLSEYLHYVLERLAQFVEYDSCSIMLDTANHLEIVAQRGFRSNQQNFSYTQLEHLQHVQQVIRDRRPVIISDTDQDPRWFRLPQDEYIRCWLGVPLIYKDQTIGVLNLDKIEANYYNQNHLADVTAFASHAAIAIHNAQIFQEIQRREKVSRELVAVSGILAEKRDLDTQLKAVWEFVSAQLHANMFFVALAKDLPLRLKFEIAYDQGHPVHLTDVLLSDPTTWGWAGYVFHHQKSLEWSSQAQKENILKEIGVRSRVRGLPSQSGIVRPIEASGQRIGVISMQSDRAEAWSDQERNAFDTLVAQVAVNIQNTRLLEEVLHGSEYLKNAYMASERITSQLNPKEVLRQIVENTHKRLGVWWACVLIMDADGTTQYIESANFFDMPNPTDWTRPGGYSRRVFDSGKAVFIEDIAVLEDMNPRLSADGVRAAACLPLISNERKLGVLWVHYPETRKFSEGEQNAWRLYANQAAIAYENALKMLDLENIRAASEGFSQAETVEEVVQCLVDSSRKVFDCDSAIFLHTSKDQNRLTFDKAAVSGIPAEEWGQFLQHTRAATMPTDMFTARDFLEAPRVQERHADHIPSPELYQMFQRLGIRASETILLKLPDERQGAIFINYHRPYSPTRSNQQKAVTLANQASMALKRASLLEHLQRVKAASQVATQWTVRGDLQSTLNAIVQGTINTLEADVVTLYAYNQERDRFDYPPAMQGVEKPEKVLELNYVDRSSMPFKVIAMDSPYVVTDTTIQSVFGAGFTEREGVKSLVAVPLIAAGEKVGVMFINYREHHSFTKQDLSNINLFSNLAAIAISFVKQSEKIRGQQQEAAGRLFLDYMGVMSSTYFHSIKGHIATISNTLGSLEKDLNNNAPREAVNERLGKIKDALSEIRAIPNYPTSNEDFYESIPINSLINERLTQFRRKKGKYEDKVFDADFYTAETVKVRGYAEHLRRALDILINNSVDAVENSPKKHITIETRQDPLNDRVEIRVRDTGGGIPDEIRAKLIRQPIPKKLGERGSGIGLYLAGIIFSMHQGSVEVESSGPTGTSMLIRIPIEKFA